MFKGHFDKPFHALVEEIFTGTVNSPVSARKLWATLLVKVSNVYGALDSNNSL